MTKRLEGKVVLLTGAGGGLGTAQARLMAEEGATLMLANLPEDPIIAEGKASSTAASPSALVRAYALSPSASAPIANTCG